MAALASSPSLEADAIQLLESLNLLQYAEGLAATGVSTVADIAELAQVYILIYNVLFTCLSGTLFICTTFSFFRRVWKI